MLEDPTWHAAPPAALSALDKLRQSAPASLPESYMRLLAFSDGGEGPLPVSPYNLCLYSSDEVLDGIRMNNFGQADLEGLLIFGGNGGGEYLAFDLSVQAPWPVVTVDMVAGGERANSSLRTSMPSLT